MGSAISDRVELAKLCASRDWSKAIRLLDSLLSHNSPIQDICNRAFCYSQLELHKHVIKDCDRALQLDPTLLRAYILKGRAFSALGRKQDALLVWEQGYEHAMHQSADLNQLIELDELLTTARQDTNGSHESHMMDTSRLSVPVRESVPHTNTKTDALNEDHNKSRSNVAINDSGLFSNGKPNDTSEDSSKSRSLMPVLTNGKENILLEDREKASDETSLCNALTTEVHQNSNDNLNASHNRSSDSAKGNKKLDGHVNGAHDVLDKRNDTHREMSNKSKGTKKVGVKINGAHGLPDKLTFKSESTNSSSGASSSTLSTVNNSVLTHETTGKLRNKNDINGQTSDSDKKAKKFSVARISKTKSISVDFRLSRGIAQVNEGRYAHAISIFDQILKEDPTYPEALIGRGTAYAFQRELNNAIADFTKAIQSNPSAGEAWKRRGQARAALGESLEAIGDLSKALEFEPNSADILHERGIVNFKYKDFGAAVEDLTACLKLDKNNQSAYTYLGLALSSIGEYKRAEEAHLKAIQIDSTFLEAWTHLTQFYQDLAKPTKALDCLQQVLQIDERFSKAYHLRGLLFHGIGEHRKAIRDLSIGLSIENANIECLYLRASCYHAIGEYGAAIKDYDATLDIELDSMEKFVLQCLAFYQKEIALYTAAKVNNEFWWFDIDRDIDPLFKEYWCKRLHPKNVCEKVYRQPPLRESLKKGKLRKQDFSLTKPKLMLLQASDSIGKKIQYDCPGFLPNRRQHRMAGLAAIEIAQKISKAWRSLQTEWKYSNKGALKNGKKSRRRDRLNIPSLNRGGAGCSTSSSSRTSTSYGTIEDRSSGRSVISWQDVYSFAVKWRQISEPCDPVVWVHKLSEEFNAGFGSHTPMVLGQAKIVRYYPNYEKTLDVAKSVIKDKRHVHNKAGAIIDLSKDGKLQNIMDANSCSDLHKVVGEDFWLSTWCNSTAFEGKRLEGTRITLSKMGEHGFDFAIKTPCMPSRWDDFDAEMTVAWETVCNACCGESYASTDFDALENVRDAILRMTYYWYKLGLWTCSVNHFLITDWMCRVLNLFICRRKVFVTQFFIFLDFVLMEYFFRYNFMPLSRGTASVGFVVMLGLLLAANMEFTGTIPQGLQVDWEAILNYDPDSFVDSMKRWLDPSLKVATSWKDYPDVGSTFATVGSIVAALSSFDS